MFRFILIALLLGMASMQFSEPAHGQDSDWKMVFNCEFDSAKDLKKWNVMSRWDNANNELQAYRANNVSVHNGCLYIEARKQDIVDGGRTKKYTSGRMDTDKKFSIKYGRFDCRFKVPRGKGYWPAFWLLPSSGNWPPEIDWMEILGHRPEIIEVTNHYGSHVNGKHPWHGPKRYETHPDFSEEFHTLSGVWNEREIICYVDGKQISVSHDGVPHEKMYVILNLAVGGDLPGSPDDTTPFPASFVVDYVRVYKAKS
jgi:beta-glucanase (GH16 family)